MTIIYSLSTSRGNVTLQVFQVTSYALFLEGDLVDSGVVQTSSTVDINTAVDGKYTLTLDSGSETTVTENISVIKNLQYSLSRDLFSLVQQLCSSDKCGLALYNNIVAKFYSYSLMFISKYGQTSFNNFNTYISQALEAESKSIRSKINSIIREDRIQSSNPEDLKLLSKFLIKYWAGFYFIEKKQVDPSNLDEMDYIQEKFFFEKILKHVDCLCVDINEMETIFNNNIEMTQIYQHQLDFVGQGIEDLVDQKFYTNSYNQSQMLAGISITFNNIAKFGFIVKDASKNPYKIVDPFGNDITDSFDYYYLDNVSYYLSKENVSYSTIPFKFQKK
jgi:hypothetical protein